MLERRGASVQSLFDDVVLVAQEPLEDARPANVARKALVSVPVGRTTPSVGVAKTENRAFDHVASLVALRATIRSELRKLGVWLGWRQLGMGCLSRLSAPTLSP